LFLSNTVTSSPSLSRCAAAATPLIPEPITATFLMDSSAFVRFC
jgi:hypothetical protein